ncbi:MAG: serine/threonine protein phosphatase [Clostridiaceae bacterium]|nr:serine/threonine protein phosphatase [Clostridiaceae bacterium]
MAIFAISDLHLSKGCDKPMDIFGSRWIDFEEKLKKNWIRFVGKDDTVLIPGDISWAITQEEALFDLLFLEELPGEKILCKGNHDFWWGTNGKVERFMEANKIRSIHLLKNNAYLRGSDVICGSRGWILPESTEFSAKDRTILNREVGRLERSLQEGIRLLSENGRLIVMLHHPPFPFEGGVSPFSLLCEQYKVSICLYGHLHGRGHEKAVEGVVNGVEYRLISADYIAFKPIRL